ncbi:MAG: cyclically-permuted mutarotase family protein [Bacteroides sp.]|nr:cyclically-permuted mutarotase family protein [Bacteroides sp.]MCM1413536.1 cyclically-permuted mutarotase family protein [Bacteroides sp.]MCM1471090.1 cyclically-permuted mutarotase family protein [Bacteroides sp.]
MKFSQLCSAVIIMTALAIFTTAAQKPVRVACVGNSITYGYTTSDPPTTSYPAQLQRILGDGYEVAGFARPGATLLRSGHRPFNEQPEYQPAVDYAADIAVIHLGVNDTDPRNWPNYGDRFINDYVQLVDSLRSRNPAMRVIIANLTPIRASHYRFRSGTRQWLREIREVIPQIAEATGAELIDFDIPLRDRPDLMPDGIHPNDEGSRLLAETVAQAITGDYPFSLPGIYSDGMVMQRDRYLPISGSAKAGAPVSLTLDGRTYTTRADNLGRWTVTAVPLITGGPYTMTVASEGDTINITDILAGEVWIASGQSNMEFTLPRSEDATADISQATDPNLRFFNMPQVDRTVSRRWDDSVMARVNRLEYFTPTHWEESTPASASQMSAIAYYFGRQLRDSLGVPVGVICNAVGGSPAESWIDMTTLEDNMPEILLNYRGNDYLQPWCQQRIRENSGDNPSNRHPYEPSYLYAAGIKPLGSFPVKGAIWYQGESNAHNTMLHEQLFPLLLQSWRKHFNDPTMPFVFAQLSSIDRPSWPTFRDSQRRLARDLDNVWMAVTSDYGDSLDVHPVQKKPVADRMARQALYHVYGHHGLTPAGPEPERITRHGNQIIISFANGRGLRTSDGQAPRTFEIAGSDGIFKPATAIINNNEITLSNMNIKQPEIVRYGWQPYTRANVVNADGLPLTTFSERAEGTDTSIEAGMECGVSAPFAAMLDNGKIVMAGGCNFPTDPMATDSRKKFYRGIYVADTTDMQWRRIGSLDETTAYGATAATPKGIVLIGGTPEGKPSAQTSLLITDGTTTAIEPLPSLPATLDNMAAAAIGNRVYVAGGNLDGTPSTRLYMLDLDRTTDGWRQLRSLPGNPRVQPVMAAARAANGEQCLYLWGGFAGRHGKHEPTLELGGLRYSPTKDKWTVIAGPTDAAGEPLSVGGGAAVTLSDGRIAVAGGVNKDIFIEALRNQAPDYLQHPIEWYRFNPNVLVFDPTTETWTVATVTPDAARAGAAMVAGTNADIYLMGGELKPRIRTAQTLHVENL